MVDKLLSINNLTAWYEKDRPIIKNLNMTVNNHQVIGLIGRNGSGKTTLFKVIASTLNTYHLENFQWLSSRTAVESNQFKLNRAIVFDDDHSFEYFNFHEYVEYVFKSYQKNIPNLTELINGFNFAKHQNTLLKDLSMGNRKKAFLITSFALRLPLLILDEPVNGLDFESTEFLYKIIKDYKTYGSILFSSHVMESITLTSNQVLILEKGEIKRIFEGDEVKNNLIREALRNDHNN